MNPCRYIYIYTIYLFIVIFVYLYLFIYLLFIYIVIYLFIYMGLVAPRHMRIGTPAVWELGMWERCWSSSFWSSVWLRIGVFGHPLLHLWRLKISPNLRIMVLPGDA